MTIRCIVEPLTEAARWAPHASSVFYVAYAFTVPHTDALLAFVAVMGLARVNVAAVAPTFDRTPRRFTGWLLLAAGGAFGLLSVGVRRMRSVPESWLHRGVWRDQP
ncbi:hypothetical protein WEI85_37450 [Actinomycetes bacterium KLBMP 9797]